MKTNPVVAEKIEKPMYNLRTLYSHNLKLYTLALSLFSLNIYMHALFCIKHFYGFFEPTIHIQKL